MKDFGRWLADQGKEPELPEGIIEKDGTYMAQCCCCEKWDELPCDIKDIPPTGYEHYCGGSPWCCP